MIVKRVTRVSLNRTTEPSQNDLAAYAGTEYWRVEWTEIRGGRANELGSRTTLRPRHAGM
jgi:hypothetical protein